jgi:hypothetical protein
MGGSEEDMAIVAGFAGGIALSGSGCGVLAAAIWMKTLQWLKDNPDKKSAFPNPVSKTVLEKFMEVAEYEFECPKLSGKKFNSVKEHTEFVRSGGCAKIIEVLATA